MNTTESENINGTEIVLKGKTQKGKNRIREIGEKWVVVRIDKSVLFSNQEGPWMLVRPHGDKNNSRARWVHPKRDENFEVVERIRS